MKLTGAIVWSVEQKWLGSLHIKQSQTGGIAKSVGGIRLNMTCGTLKFCQKKNCEMKTLDGYTFCAYHLRESLTQPRITMACGSKKKPTKSGKGGGKK